MMIGIALAALLVAPGATFGQDGSDDKQTGWLTSVCKSGLTKEDREATERYLSERRGDLKRAPDHLVVALEASGLWAPDLYGPFAQEVPEKLARQLSAPKSGTFRVIFHRSLLVISAKGGKVVDSVGPLRF